MEIKFKIKRFNELSLSELYEVLKLRSEVFVVEQNCVYLDIDGKDEKALHVLGMFGEELVAYARIFKPGDYFEEASIGRVLVKQIYRNKKWGYDLMNEAIRATATVLNEAQITISAQLYLQQFYENVGFVRTSDEYLEDAIPHIEMKKK
ncbi:GNAT family N-acetyltransferase [Flavobacterium sp.]|uniref:GNAT family N-acetyltransferase n=1 Tax=Flavobacterium sp. TaxID=239 RepID=UPI0026229508|nr:GNAT family N-acetyltransferase [Flavobacterium sp.]MDD2984872.1 GNAT family N-acetyltransferase [Flavobacterium sp.]